MEDKMNKKLLVSVLLFCFVFSSIMLAQKGEAKSIEHLLWILGGRSGIGYYFYPNDFTSRENFESDPLMTFHVPASKNYDALFFQTWATAQVVWEKDSPVYERAVRAFFYLRIISPLIPNNIDIFGGGSVIATAESKADGIYEKKGLRDTRYRKFILTRDNVDYWYVMDTVSGEYINDDGLIFPILNNLIDNGFDVEVFTEGFIQGARYFTLFPFFSIEVTRLWKN